MKTTIKSELITAARELMAGADLVYLASVDQAGQPCIRTLFNLRNTAQFPVFTEVFQGHGEDLLVYLGTNTSSSKIAQMENNPAVALYYADASNFHGLMLSGKAEISRDDDLRRMLWIDGWEMYYPAGPTDPDYSIVTVRPSRMRGWYRSQAFEYPLP